MEDEIAKKLALSLAAICVRNTFLEDLHAGSRPSLKTGDYSDVKVVTANGEIPWNKLQRISDDEMRQLMKEVVNKLYSILVGIDEPEFLEAVLDFGQRYTRRWDEPQNLNLFKSKRRLTEAQGEVRPLP